MTAGFVATSLVFWPAAPFFLFMHGKEISIPKGAEITAYVNGDMKLEASRFRGATNYWALYCAGPATSLFNSRCRRHRN